MELIENASYWYKGYISSSLGGKKKRFYTYICFPRKCTYMKDDRDYIRFYYGEYTNSEYKNYVREGFSKDPKDKRFWKDSIFEKKEDAIKALNRDLSKLRDLVVKESANSIELLMNSKIPL